MRTGCCNLPLHSGKCPKWLFHRMKKLAGVISEIIIDEYGQNEFIKRLSNPYFFQALGCVIGFDWHSSGLSTTTCGALKESVNNLNLGITVAGGKGKTSRKTQEEIENSNLLTNKIQKLQYASRITAKVDTSLIQDSYQLYHHTFIFTDKGKWTVIQQGMNNHYARRYHWLSDNVIEFVEEPHSAICCDQKQEKVLDMTSNDSRENREICVDLIKDNPKHLEKYMKLPAQKTLDCFTKKTPEFTFSPRHDIINMNKINMQTLRKAERLFVCAKNPQSGFLSTLQKAYEIQPENYEKLLAIKGVGPKTIRSLALISEIIYGKKASWKDPVKYSFAFGGKDKIPYEIERKHYDQTVNILRSVIDNAKIGNKDKLHALRRLNCYLKY